MFDFAQWVVLSAGWPRRLAAALAGAVGALALAPVDVMPAMLVPMVAAVWLIDGAARRETGLGRVLGWRSCMAAAVVGWWWGFGYFLAGLWWLGAAFLVEPDRYLWALPFGVVAVPAGLALFPAFGFGVARLLWSSGPGRLFALTAGLGTSEWLRSWLFTGFPWNAYGMAFGGTLTLAQGASAFGLEGLTLLTILLCAAPATLADPVGSRLRRLAPTVLAAVAMLVLLGFGAHRLDRGPTRDVPNVRLRLMQPDTPEDGSFSYANKDKILAGYLALSNRATGPDPDGLKTVTHLIWPESPFPFILSRDPDALGTIAAAMPDSTVLVTGAARAERDAEINPGQPGRTHYFNAIQVVGPGGTVLDSYDKVHLVPFGEYLPFDALLRAVGLTNFVHVPGGFDAGTRRRLLDVPGLPPVAPQICYEAIFPGAVLPEGPEAGKAGVMLNVTNDGWFGTTAGPYQHLAQARLRAVEEGLPLIRAANTGVSAIVDPYGRITASLPLDTVGVLDGTLPQRIAPTLFARHWGTLQPALYLAAFGFALLSAIRRRG
ncbi:apolipoprotein N-acyltransferase [Lichenihabitans sp. Uapishka_5]|uniref:apolipoprotein N-acyltransferase n=1 Tax=Lichenihabitans sp. Uapishka_5 TaxID=3037302 RepID=UPI0029E7CB36|nr:apolipoprotein N-acyltransferase [Lichenihabitans sp. Uapishka_5]MDX7950685.1 apolipoprotein N-acyltransferase [Lichenihabitans sp. Uapishka_5]